MIDIKSSLKSSYERNEHEGNWKADVKFINYEGNITMEYEFELKNKTMASLPVSQLDSHIHFYKSVLHQIYDEYVSGHLTKSNYVSICEPVCGEVPFWRQILSKYIVALVLFTLLILPLLVILWFLFASIFYIFYESEMRRRDKIENNRKKYV
jgi:hypothetical protein